MKGKVLFCSLLLCCSSLLMAQQDVSTGSLVADEKILAVDSIKKIEQTDSTAIALRSLASVEVDSTQMVLDQVKALTDMISEQSLINAHLVKDVFSDTAIVNKYNRLLDRMVAQYSTEVESISALDTVHVNPLYFRLFAPLTLYQSPISQAMAIDTFPVVTLEDSLRLAAMVSGRDLRLLNELDRVLLSTYLASPSMVGLTETKLKASQNFSEETMKKVSESVKLDVSTTAAAPLVEIKPQVVADMVIQKPNFWVTKGSFSTQMTESYFSPNWYQGGVNNLNVLSMLTLEANYNNKRKIQWSNKLDARLGFYQNQNEDGEMDKIQSNQDLLRLTSKLNLKAIRNWNYAVEAQGNTQMLNHYDESSDPRILKSGFLVPADLSLTVGMDFKKSFSKGSISIYPGPLSYKMIYVANRKDMSEEFYAALAKGYGIDQEGKRSRHDLGSKLEVNFDYKITPNISYKTRFYFFTAPTKNAENDWYRQMDWENTLNFQVSKYISTKLFFHSRYDDLVEPYEKWKYIQFKQYFMLGLNYTW